MAIRLLPFRQYNETDVINLFAIDPTGTSEMANPFASGDNDAGVLVKVKNGNMTDDPVNYANSTYLGKTDYPFIGRDQYPVVPLRVSTCANESTPLGVTLRQTLTHDENGEKLLYYPQKAIELYAVLTGQAVPVLTRGVVTFDDGAFTDPGSATIGGAVYPAAEDNPGKLSATQGNSAASIGTCIATGVRVNRGVAPDYFAGVSIGTGAQDNLAGRYFVVKLECK